MAEPVPPPPPAKGLSLLTWLLLAAFAIAVLGYFQGWFEFKKNPDTGKNELVVHKEKFSKDKDAFLKKSGEYANSAKDKIASMMKKKEDAKPEDKAAIDKQIAELKQKLEKLETLKDAEKLSDEAALKKANEGVDEIKKLLDSPK